MLQASSVTTLDVVARMTNEKPLDFTLFFFLFSFLLTRFQLTYLALSSLNSYKLHLSRPFYPNYPRGLNHSITY